MSNLTIADMVMGMINEEQKTGMEYFNVPAHHIGAMKGYDIMTDIYAMMLFKQGAEDAERDIQKAVKKERKNEVTEMETHYGDNRIVNILNTRTGSQEQSIYDKENRLLEYKNYDGKHIKYTYNQYGLKSILEENGNSLVMHYDEYGNLMKTIECTNGKKTVNRFDV